MLPAAPPRFSTTSDCPSFSVNLRASSLATTSVLPPGAKPTTIRTGFAGYCWAYPALAAITSSNAAATRRLEFFTARVSSRSDRAFGLGRQLILRITDHASRLQSCQLRLGMAEPFAEHGVVAGAQR